MIEYIICSAIYIDDKQKHQDQPTNIKSGFVISGRRHNNCYATLLALLGPEYMSATLDSANHKDNHQGFITSLNKYVDRKEGFLIAKEAKQLLYPKLYDHNQPNFLTSECLFPTDWEKFTY